MSRMLSGEMLSRTARTAAIVGAAIVGPAVLGAGGAAAPAWAGPAVAVGAAVPPERQIPVERIDHRDWDALLQKYVDDAGFVAYAEWQGSADDQRRLDGYLAQLSAARFGADSPREAVLAFWINAYNAVTVKGILREYPTTSIRNHTAKLVGYNIWKDLQLTVSGRPYSLDAMEHEVLRKQGEPRVHFAIVCASIGCPRLLNRAYAAEHLDAQLTYNAQAFFADPEKFRLDARSGALHLSPILDWFGGDFGADTPARLRTLAPYLPEAARPLALSGRARVAFLDYDWGLNDQAQRPRTARR